jgi:predicted transcriptional regulator
MHGKTMREALNEVRSFRDTTEGGPGSGPQKGGKKFSSSEIKKAYGILNDPRYKQGNYSGAAKAIDKLSPGLSNHPDVKNAMKRANEELEEERSYTVIHTKHGKEVVKANGTYDAAQKYAKMKGLKDTSGVDAHLMEENLDLPATGDTTTSNASQEVEQVEEESINEFKLKDSDIEKLKKGVKQGKPIKVFKLNKPVKAGYGEELEEAKFTPAQISKLQTTYGKLGPGYEKNAIRMNQLAKMMRKYSKDHLSQLADLDIPMVSKVAKELMKEEIDEAVVGLPFSRTLMYIIKTDRNTAKKIKSFLADNGEKYPIYIDDNDSGQITLDAYNYTGGEKKAALAAAQAIAKKFNVKVTATR